MIFKYLKLLNCSFELVFLMLFLMKKTHLRNFIVFLSFFSEIFPRDLNLKDKFIKHFTGKHELYQ